MTFRVTSPQPCRIGSTPCSPDNGTYLTDPTGDGWTPEDIKETRAQKLPFRRRSFELACACACAGLDIEHRLAKPRHPWTNGQVERMNRTVKKATVKRCHHETHDQLRGTSPTSPPPTNSAHRLKTLRGLTPCQAICNASTDEPGRFISNPQHQSQGTNIYAIRGLLPAFLKLLKPLPAPDILAHRILWSLALLLILVTALKQWPTIRRTVTTPRLILALTASATLIAINWLCYIIAVNGGHVAQASLGYFINPLVNMLLGVVILRERLGRVEIVAVALAAMAVTFLAWEQGGFPVIPLTLALSFGSYGLIRKVIPVEALDGLLIETAILTPPSILWLALAGPPIFGVGLAAGPAWPLLPAAGVLTAIPLVLFAAAAKRVRYRDLGLLQYIAPTLQLVLAVAVYDEVLRPMNGPRSA